MRSLATSVSVELKGSIIKNASQLHPVNNAQYIKLAELDGILNSQPCGTTKCIFLQTCTVNVWHAHEKSQSMHHSCMWKAHLTMAWYSGEVSAWVCIICGYDVYQIRPEPERWTDKYVTKMVRCNMKSQIYLRCISRCIQCWTRNLASSIYYASYVILWMLEVPINWPSLNMLATRWADFDWFVELIRNGYYPL